MPYQSSRLIDRRSVLAATALIAAAPATVLAQADYPNHAIKFVVPVPPGNMLDAMPRIIGDKLSPRWNQPVIVENKTRCRIEPRHRDGVQVAARRLHAARYAARAARDQPARLYEARV